MKDAHGNNIYEHDLIKDVVNGVIGEVLYVNLRWVVKIVSSETSSRRPGFVYDLNSYYNFDAIDIIGNTYDGNEIKKAYSNNESTNPAQHHPSTIDIIRNYKKQI